MQVEVEGIAEVEGINVQPHRFDPEKLNAAIARFTPLLGQPDVQQEPLPLRLRVYDCLDSTSDRLRQYMDEGAPAGTAVLALRQTQGRGQQGRAWNSEVGGLYLSLGLRPNLPASEGARLSLGSAWGVATMFQRLGIPVELKWPNDLLLPVSGGACEAQGWEAQGCEAQRGKAQRGKAQGRGGQGGYRKLGGILTESRLRGDRIYQALIGIGINWENHPPAPGIALKPWLQAQGDWAEGDGGQDYPGGQRDRPQFAPEAYAPPPADSKPVLKNRLSRRITSLEGLTALVWLGLLAGCQRWQNPASSLEALIQDYEKLINVTGRTVQIGREWGMITGITTTGELKVSSSAGTRLFPPGAIRLGYD